MKISLSQIQELPCIHSGDQFSLYLYEDNSYNCPLVIKTLTGNYTEKEAAILSNEYELLKDINIPEVYKAFRLIAFEEGFALIMEYVEGETIKNTFIKQRKSISQTLEVMAAITRAVHHIHSNNIIHNNINSDNILIDSKNNSIKVIDFGLAVRTDSEILKKINTEATGNSPLYMSPEQTGRLNLRIDKRSDLYSLGILFYAMLTGKTPFEDENPAELLHCHIAKIPTPLHMVHRGMPIVISDIVMKLLSKAPEDRYQSTYGLIADLKKSLSQLIQHNRISSFPIAQKDYSGRLTIPAKIYNHQEESTVLKHVYERVRSGSAESVFITGMPGVGKTALVRSFKETASGSYFISGTYSQIQHSPYYGLNKAFDELVKLLLSEGEEQLVKRRREINQALGRYGKLLTDLIPNLEIITGNQPEINDINPVEAQTRFHYILKNFIKAVAGKEHPIVIFLDNLQWADEALISFLESFSDNNDCEYLMLICAYQEEDTSSIIAMNRFLNRLDNQDKRINFIKIEALNSEYLNLLIADCLQCKPEQTKQLTDLIHEKTDGNPFFAIRFLQMLYEEGLIRFRYDNLQWVWDTEEIRKKKITDNVIELLTRKYLKLPETTRNLISLAAHMGHTFDLNMLSAVSGLPYQDVSGHLWQSAAEGITLPCSPAINELTEYAPNESKTDVTLFKFSDNSIRQVAFNQIPNRIRDMISLEIGRYQLQTLSNDDVGKNIFEITDHFNQGFKYIKNAEDKLQLVRLNLAAGQKAKKGMAYKAAIRYLSMAIGLLPLETKWEQHYDLTVQLYLEAVEAEFLMTTFERAEILSDEVLHHARNIEEIIRIYQLRIQFHASLNLCREAIQAGIKALNMLEIDLPETDEELKSQIEELNTRIYSYDQPCQKIPELPVMEDSKYLMAVQILMNLTAPAHQTHPDLLELIILKILDYTITYGLTPQSAFACAWYGILLCSPGGDPIKGALYGDIALSLVEKIKETDLKFKVLFLINNYLNPWIKTTVSDDISQFSKCPEKLESGDKIYEYFGALGNCSYYLYIGFPIKKLRARLAHYLEDITKLRLSFHKDYSIIWKQTLINLQDNTQSPHLLNGNLLYKDILLPEWKKQNNQILLFSYYCCQTMLAYLFGDYKIAIESGKTSEIYEKGGRGSLYLPMHNFYYALSITAVYPEAKPDEKIKYMEKINEIQEKFKFWAENSPAFLKSKYLMLNAEKARISGDISTAILLIGQSIKHSRSNHLIQDLAVAYELESRLFEEMGRIDIASGSVKQAMKYYHKWGAYIKENELKPILSQYLKQTEHTEEFFEETDKDNKQEQEYTENGSLTSVIDSSAIIRASHSLAQELNPNVLLQKIIKIVIENSGAQRAVLIENSEKGLIIIAEGSENQDQPKTGYKTPIEEVSDLPVSIVNYVAHTRASLVINNALMENTFSSDSYFKSGKPKALLCTPIIHNEKLLGILYLENSVSANIFNRKRQDVLHFLLTQAAISMINASLYLTLEKKIEELEYTKNVLCETEERYRSLVENIDMGITLIDKNHNILMTNSGQGRIFKKNPELFTGKKCYNEFEKRTTICPHCPGVKAMDTGKPQEVDTIGYNDAGEPIYGHIRAYPVYNKSKEVLGFIEVVEDTTNIRKQEKARLESEAKYKMIVDTANEGIVTIDADDNLTFVNERMAEMFGYKPEELVGASMFIIKFPEDIAAHKKIMEGRRKFKQEQYEVRFMKSNGEALWAIVSATPMIDSEGKYAGSFAMLTDITARKKAEQELQAAHANLEHQVELRTMQLAGAIDELRQTQAQLVESEKMAALATLVAGVAHEINTPVGIGITAASHLAEKTEYYQNLYNSGKITKADMEEFIYIIREASSLVLTNLDKTDKLVQNFKQVSVNQSSGEKSVFNLFENLTETLEKLKHRCKTENHRIVVDCPADIEMDSYPGALYRIIAHLILNSMIHGFEERETGNITINAQLEIDRVTIKYSDDGKGIDSQSIGHIFEPFYTTRRNTGGTGLGLHIVYNLVTQSLKGMIQCISKPGLGTTFIIKIPVKARED